MSESVDAALSRLFGPGVNSDTRAEHMLREMKGRPTEEAFAIFAEAWSGCDDTWRFRGELLLELKKARCSVVLLACIRPEDRDWFGALPEELTIYRGCDRERKRGLIPPSP